MSKKSIELELTKFIEKDYSLRKTQRFEYFTDILLTQQGTVRNKIKKV